MRQDPPNIGTHLKGLNASIQMVPSNFWLVRFWVNSSLFGNFVRNPVVPKGLSQRNKHGNELVTSI